MSHTHILDSHIHLWPASMSNIKGHKWMTPGMPLAREHLLEHYNIASTSSSNHSIVDGVVYVETDVRYSTPTSDLPSWTQGPLDEIRFLRSLLESKRDGLKLKAIVAWAPMDQPPSVLQEWLDLAEKTAGTETWKQVKGFRFLMQGITDREKFERLVWSDNFVENLQLLGRRGYSFDVGVDHHSGGIWQLQAFAKTMARAYEGVKEEEKVVFVLNHLCKPDFRPEKFEEWSQVISTMAAIHRTYVKLSGAFSELPPGLESIVEHIRPWIRHVFKSFGPERVMFGSDWPVCNVKGPEGEDSWTAWTDIVRSILEDEELGLSTEHKERVWSATAIEAYAIQ